MNRWQHIPWRHIFITTVLLCLFAIIIGRLVQLMVIQRDFLLNQGNMRVVRTMRTPPFRGMITDRYGEPLAVSTPVESICANPQVFNANKTALRKLSYLLHMPPSVIKKIMKKNKQREFVYLKRGVSPKLAEKIKTLDIIGVFTKTAFRRFYPQGEVTAQLIGLTNIDDEGQEGLELQFNDWLKGSAGKRRVVKDRLGNVVTDIDDIESSKAGNNLILSIDERIQYAAYRALKAGTQRYHAKAGSAIVLNVKTGEVLGIVNTPSFNPNNRPKAGFVGMRNRAVTDVFEPGSTMKAFSVASALDSQKFSPKSEINTSPGYFYVHHNRIQDETNHGRITVREVLELSSNVGVSKMTLALPAKQLVGLLKRLGFTQRTRSAFPGEQAGQFSVMDHWRAFELATLSFGYGISVTALQLAHAYAVIANHGLKMPITLIKGEERLGGKQVIEKHVASEMLSMLEGVVARGGTGYRARVRGYRVAGKTGTAYIAEPGGYSKHRYVASFVGMAPVSHPEVVVAVVLYDVQGQKHYGGQVSAPIFAEIMGDTLRIMNIVPDRS